MARYKTKRKFHSNKFGQVWDGESYDLQLDRQLKAKKVGKRESKAGNTYYEYRRNRTDAKNRI